MIDAGTAFAAAVAQSSRRFRLRMYDGNNEIAGSVRSAKIHMGSTGPGAFAIGAVYSAYAEIVLDGRETTLEGKELRLDIGVLTDPANDTYLYMTLGYFTALAPAATKYRTTFTACGRIVSKLAVTDFTAPATQTLQAVADAITTQTGVTVTFDSGIDTSLVIDTPITGNCRDALTRLAECVMGYATETNTGAVRIARFAVVPTTTRDAADMVTLPAITDINFEITGVQAITNTGVFETGTPNVSIESNYITEALFNQFAPSLVGIEYRPGNVQLALGDPRIEPSDVLSVTVDSDVYVVPCLSITHTFDGGLQTEIVTPSVQNVGKVTGTLSQAVKDAEKKADQAAEDADNAKKVATSYLSRDASGFMVANLTGDIIYTPGTVPAGVLNAFISADKFQIRDGQTVLATYGTEAAIYSKDGTELAHFGYAAGTAASGVAIKPYYTFGSRVSGRPVGNFSTAMGAKNEASGYSSTAIGVLAVASGLTGIAIGSEVTASGNYAVAMGDSTTASGNHATAIGYAVAASGTYTVAMGMRCTASGTGAVAMGYMTEAEGEHSTAMGIGTSTSGVAAAAFGSATAANGDNSTAMGLGTVATSDCQTARGKYNRVDTNGIYAEIVGNGGGPGQGYGLQSNAYALTWDGDARYSLDTAADIGTLDMDLYDLLTALGWDSDVFADGMLSLKKTLKKILQALAQA